MQTLHALMLSQNLTSANSKRYCPYNGYQLVYIIAEA